MQLAVAKVCDSLYLSDAGAQALMLHFKERDVDVGHGVCMASSLQDARDFCL